MNDLEFYTLPDPSIEPAVGVKSEGGQKHGDVLPLEAIIMAGGRGERLRPLTDNTPKPMIKVGDKPISEYTVANLSKIGIKHFTFCVNYLGGKIKAHFRDGAKWNAQIDYVSEGRALGTIGGLRLKEKFIYDDLLIINGDILTKLNFRKFFGFYLEQNADLAIAVIPYRIDLPYGIIQTDESQQVHRIDEKPTYTHYINTGIYLLKKEHVGLIPENQVYDAIDLIQRAMDLGLKVVSFPVLDYWIDIGKWEDYEKAQNDIKILEF